jgi:hypothetical protein
MKNVVSDIKTLAEAEGYVWIHGPRDYANYELTTKDITGTEFIFVLLPVITSANSITDFKLVEEWSLDIQIMFGQKFDVAAETAEADEYSSIDETYNQKYDRRIYDLTTTLHAFIEQWLCGSVYRLQSLRIDEEVNQFDENADFVIGRLTIRYDESD